MAQLCQDFDDFVKLNTVIMAIGPDNARAYISFWQAHSLPFIGIPDPKGIVLKRYGQQVKLLKLGRMPAQVIVDKAGLVRYIHYGQSMSDIPSNREILEILSAL